MHRRHLASRSGKIAQVLFLGFLVSALSAQLGQSQRKIGFPEDWTHHRMKFNTAALRQHLEVAAREPRAAIQLYREAAASFKPTPEAIADTRLASSTPHADWSVSFGLAATGAKVAPGQFPAKWNSNVLAPITAANCTTDYVVYGLNVAGVTGGQANLVGLNNLYSGSGTALCPNLQPSFLFSFNVTTVANGKVVTSPVISLDGKKVAFLETVTGAGKTTIFHVLTVPTSNPSPGFPFGGSTTTAVKPTGRMTSLTIVANSDTRSSPWVDYVADAAYFAADDGRLYKVQPVFTGTPALVTTSPWPILIKTNNVLSSPVLDVTGNIFMGAGTGVLYSVNVNSTTPVVTSLTVGSTVGGGTNPGVIDAPIVDSTGGSVFAVSANDTAVAHNAVVVQASTSNLAEKSRISIGQGSTGGTSVTIYDGDFDNNFTTPLTGHLLICGTGSGDTTPHRYLLGFDGAGNLVPDASPVQLSTNTASRCGPVTDFFNSNLGTDFLFWSVSRACATVPARNGCIMSLANGVPGPTSPQEFGGASGIIVDNNSLAGQASSIYFGTEAHH